MRNELIEKLAFMWRKAENRYLETDDDLEKWKVKEYQDTLKLTDEEIEELNSICCSMGV